MENMLSHVFFCFVGGQKEVCTQYTDKCVFYLLKYIGNFTAFWYF